MKVHIRFEIFHPEFRPTNVNNRSHQAAIAIGAKGQRG